MAEPEAPKSDVAQSTPGLGDRIKSMSVGAILISGAVILVVGLVVGAGVGYKVEQQRSKDDINAAKASAREQPKTAATAAPVRLVGKVGETAPDSVTITDDKEKTQHFATGPTTVVVKASPGTAADITKGSRVVWKAKSGQVAQAEEIVVLPANAKMGSLIVSATSTSMTYKNNGKDVTVSIEGATVLKVTTAKTTDITSGGKLVAQARRTSGSTLSATEVIVLPSSSKFVT